MRLTVSPSTMWAPGEQHVADVVDSSECEAGHVVGTRASRAPGVLEAVTRAIRRAEDVPTRRSALSLVSPRSLLGG